MEEVRAEFSSGRASGLVDARHARKNTVTPPEPMTLSEADSESAVYTYRLRQHQANAAGERQWMHLESAAQRSLAAGRLLRCSDLRTAAGRRYVERWLGASLLGLVDRRTNGQAKPRRTSLSMLE